MARKQQVLDIDFTATAWADWIAIWQWNAEVYGEGGGRVQRIGVQSHHPNHASMPPVEYPD